MRDELKAPPDIDDHGDAPEGPQLVTVCMADVEPRRINWLWPNRLARGKITLIAGLPGLGKSHCTLDFAAHISKGVDWPDGAKCGAGDVLILQCEDDPRDTLRPRIEAAGANLTRVHLITGTIAGFAGDGTKAERMFSFATDLAALEGKLAALADVALLIVDPISAYLGRTDAHKNSEVRGLLGPFAELAARRDLCVIAITHLGKSEKKHALERVIDSVAFTGLARSVFLVASDQADPQRQLFLPMKSNVSLNLTGLAFRIGGAIIESKIGPIETSRLTWEAAPVTVTAQEVLAGTKPETPRAAAMDWLRCALADGPVWAKDLKARALKAGISEMTYRRALTDLGAITMQAGFHGGWTWSLPTENSERVNNCEESTPAHALESEQESD